MDDEFLMRRVAVGDARAFEQIARRYERPLGQFAVRVLGNVDDARDAVQDAFLNLWRSREAYRPCGKLRSYLYRLTHNACLDLRSRTRPVLSLEDIVDAAGQEIASTSAENAGLADAVREAVTSLPEDQRAVFVLSCYDGMSYSEIAEIVGCPVGTVASRKRLAAQTLRKRLASWED